MGDEQTNSDDSETDGLQPEEAIEFLKLVQQARDEATEPPIESAESVPKPRKRFRLKAKGRKKQPQPSPAKLEKKETRPQPKRISDEKLQAILDGTEEPAVVLAEISGKTKRPARATKKAPAGSYSKKESRWLEGLLAVALLALVVKTVWSAATESDPTSTATPQAVVVAAAQGQPADLTAVYFARSLALRRYSDAHAFLSEDKGSAISVSDLKDSVDAFVEDHPDSLNNIRIASVQLEGDSAQVFLKVGTNSSLWEISLLRQQDRWLVQGLDGGIDL